jgi:hypothetical protein
MATLDINIRQANADFQAIKAAISDAGVVIDDGTKTSEYAQKITGLYEAGKKSEYDAFWDALQNWGNRENYQYGFIYWGCEYIRPKHKVIPTTANSSNQPFAYNRLLKQVEKEYFDFSQRPRGTSSTTGWYYSFYDCANLEVVEDIGINNAYGFYYTFARCEKLHTIECIYPDENTEFNTAFYRCSSLVNLRVNGTIGKNGFNVQWSTVLSKDSILSIINALSHTTASLGVTLSQTAVDKAFETSDGANDGSTSDEWVSLMQAMWNWSISLI